MKELYREATSVRFGFLYINTLEHDLSKMFYRNFDHRLIPDGAGEERKEDTAESAKS
jgi:hypothetical protein